MIKSATKKVAHIMLGLPGCGKSTKVHELVTETPGLQIICRDDIRAVLGVNGHDSNSYNPAIEPTVEYIAKNMQRAAIMRGLPVVLDETHTHPANLEKQMDYFCSRGYDVHVWYFDVSPAQCAEHRPLIGPDVYERMTRNMLQSSELLSEYARLKLVTLHCVRREEQHPLPQAL